MAKQCRSLVNIFEMVLPVQGSLMCYDCDKEQDFEGVKQVQTALNGGQSQTAVVSDLAEKQVQTALNGGQSQTRGLRCLERR